jgi:hypothetical protein
MKYNLKARAENTTHRRGLASAELAVVLSTLTFICLATCDYARSVFAAVTVTNCARNGALYLSDPTFAASTGYTSLQAAVQSDAANLSPAPTVSYTTGTDSNYDSYVSVTVSYPFQCIFNYPGISESLTISRTVMMVSAPK